MCDVNEPAPAVEPVETHFLRLDVRSDDDWAAALAWVEEHWGSLDLLVNNAGVAGGGRVDVATMDEWQWITEINLFGVVRGTRTFVPMFKAQRSGRIVNVASLAGLVHPAGMGSYNAVKAGVVAFTRDDRPRARGVRRARPVVCPSYFRTNLMEHIRPGRRHGAGRRGRRSRGELPGDRRRDRGRGAGGHRARRRADPPGRRRPAGVRSSSSTTGRRTTR